MQDDPIWLALGPIKALHEKCLKDFGGLSGIRDAGLLESAMGRARNLFAYGESDLFGLAAAYAYGIVNNHPFVDGNKRTGFVAAALFLELNGLRFTASEPDSATMTLALAEKSINEADFAQWLRDNTKPQA